VFVFDLASGIRGFFSGSRTNRMKPVGDFHCWLGNRKVIQRVKPAPFVPKDSLLQQLEKENLKGN